MAFNWQLSALPIMILRSDHRDDYFNFIRNWKCLNKDYQIRYLINLIFYFRYVCRYFYDDCAQVFMFSRVHLTVLISESVFYSFVFTCWCPYLSHSSDPVTCEYHPGVWQYQLFLGPRGDNDGSLTIPALPRPQGDNDFVWSTKTMTHNDCNYWLTLD